jgi:type II secretion system protein J
MSRIDRAGSSGYRRRAGGFTLIEMMAVVFFTLVVITAAVSFFFDLNRAQDVAMERTRLARRADALLTRVARDLGTATLLIREEGTDPLEHPWVFVAERHLPVAGADRLRFVRRGRERRGAEAHESDLETVAYTLREGGFEEGYELYRWSTSQLPESLDKSFPDASEDGALLVASGIADFGMRFLSSEGGWKDEWDSSNLGESDDLPMAAEIAVAFESGKDGAEPVPLVRQVFLPVRPINLAQELEQAAEAEAEDDEEEDGCVTVRECLDRDPVAFEAVMSNPLAASRVQALANRCVEDFAKVLGVEISRCL